MKQSLLTAVASVLMVTACSQSAKMPVVQATPVAVADPLPATIQEIRQAERSGKWELAEAGLRKMAQGSDVSLRGQAFALLGILYLDKNRAGEAIVPLNSAIAELPSLSPYLKLRLATAQQKLGKPVDAIVTAQQIIAEAPDSSAARIARIRLPGFYALANDRVTATAQLAALESLEIDEFAEPDLIAAAAFLDSAGMTDLATALRFRILRTYPQGRYTEKTFGSLQIAAGDPLNLLTYQETVDLADKLGRVNRYDQAIDLLERINKRFPEQSSSSSLSLLRARSFFNSRRYDSVIAETVAPGDPNYIAMQMLRARALWRTDKGPEFVRILNEIIMTSPTTKEAVDARVQLGKYYVTDEIDYAKSTGYLEQAIGAGASGDQGENLWTLGWTYILAGNEAQALAVFDRYLTAFPDSDYTTNALFWAGKIYHGRKDTAHRDEFFNRLIAQYPFSYYAYRAREITGAPHSAADPALSAAFPTLTSTPEQEASLSVVRQLLDLGLQKDAASEVRLLAARNPEDLGTAFRLADLYAAAGETLSANSLLQRRFRSQIRHGVSGAPQRFWEILFPLPYAESIRSAAAKYSLDPYLIPSIIRQESGFEPTVVSNAGAVGLMQLMPAEASRIATLGGLATPTREDLFDPAVNIQIGAAEIRQKLDAMNNQETLAIAAYNAGEEPVKRWLARTPIDDIDRFIESISYAETRLYVKNVTRNRNEYRRIYGTAAPPM